MAVFKTIPAIYGVHPVKTHNRRTATNIMAGHFESDLHFSINCQKDLEAVNHISAIPSDEPIAHVSSTRRRKESLMRRKRLPSGRFGKLRSTAVVGDEKKKQIYQVNAAGKEIAASALSDGEPLGPSFPVPLISRSTPPLSKYESAPLGQADARLFHTSISATPPCLKRKRSSAPTQDQPICESSKRPRLQVMPDGDSIGPSAINTGPCPQVSPPDSALVGTSTPKKESVPKKLTRIDAPKLYEVLRRAGVRCKICNKLCVTVSFMESHLRNLHSDKIDMDAMPKSAEKRPRGPRKNTAIRKGWKGWVEDQPAPRSLILLDKPEVLPERTTRSGAKIT